MPQCQFQTAGRTSWKVNAVRRGEHGQRVAAWRGEAIGRIEIEAAEIVPCAGLGGSDKIDGRFAVAGDAKRLDARREQRRHAGGVLPTFLVSV